MELLQLRRRVEDLQTELSRARISAPKGSEGLAQGDEEHSVGFSFAATAPGEYQSTTWSATFSPMWNEVFACIAPLMIHEATEPALKNALDSLAEAENAERLRENKKLARHALHSFRISQDDFQTIKVQLRALGLITKNDKARSVKDSGTYWTLTPYGDEIMTQLRAIRRNEDDGQANTEIVPGGEE